MTSFSLSSYLLISSPHPWSKIEAIDMHTSIHIFSCLSFTQNSRPQASASAVRWNIPPGRYLLACIQQILRSELISVGGWSLTSPRKQCPLPSPFFSYLTSFALLLISDIWLNIHLLICSLAVPPQNTG